MNRYRFEAADAQGRIESGHLEADSQGAAMATLRGRGLTALSLKAEGGDSGETAAGLFSAKLSDNDLAWATRQLASLLGASLPLEAALSATVEQAERKHIAQALSAVRADVRGGMRLAEALAKRPRDFPEIYRALIAAGEESGDLAQVMERLADYIEERNNLRGKVLTAFIYPAVVGLVSVGIVIFLLSYVVPQVVSAFSQARQDLPGLTLAMLNASDFIREWGCCALAGWRGRSGAGACICANPKRGWAGTAGSCACRWSGASCWGSIPHGSLRPWRFSVVPACPCCGRWKRRGRRSRTSA